MSAPFLKTREELEADELRTLAPYAQKAADSAGRTHFEPQHPYRTLFQRDRARIIHSRAFRRLEYKTQVFLNGSGDHLRTRLTHTIEVASISRTLACALGANEDLTEAIALAHDLGHAPFGHCGEEELNELMRSAGGFEHNLQSLRIVEHLEVKYPNFPGLNLSYEVLEGLRKHRQGFSRPAFGDREAETFPMPSLEAQIANRADEITYYSHDLDDGLDAGLIEPEQLEELEIWKACSQRVRAQFPELDGKRLLAYAIRSLIDYEVADVVQQTHKNLAEIEAKSADDVRRHPERVVAYSDFMRKANGQLRKFLYQNLYYHPEVAVPNNRGRELVARMFKACVDEPERMRAYFREHGVEAEKNLVRTVGDYVSGMTDRYIQEECDRLEGEGTRRLL